MRKLLNKMFVCFLGEEWSLFFFFFPQICASCLLLLEVDAKTLTNFSGVLVSLSSATHLCLFCPQSPPTFSAPIIEEMSKK